MSVPHQMGLSPDECDEVFQLTWITLHSQLDLIRRPSALPAWIVTTARHQVLRLQGQRARAAGRQVDESALLNCSDESAPDPAESTISLEQRHLVQMCVAQLGDPCRKLVSMLYLQQPSPHYDEVAEELGMSRGSIGPLRSRCLKRLAEIVERMRLE